MDNAQQVYTNQPTSRKKSKLPVIAIVVVILLVALFGGIFLFSKNKSNKPAQVAATATEAPTPSLTPTPTIDKKSVKIQVLNGTGTPGQASKVATALKNAGYNADNIKTGNSSDTVSASSISAKSGFESIASDMKNVLSGDFSDIAVSSSQLGSDSAFDIVITTGGKKYEASNTPTPVDSTTPTSATDTPTSTPTTTTTPTPTP